MAQIKIQSEEIYLCKNCNYPLSYSSLVKQISETYGDLFLNKFLADKNIDLKKYRCVFVIEQNAKTFEKMCYEVDNKNEIKCKNCKHNVGFITKMTDEIIGIPMTVGLFKNDEIGIKEIKFKNKKKEIPVISQTQYTVLEKLKQLRYYVKQLTPTLKESMELIRKEKNNIDECNDKFEKYKLNLVFNKIDKREKDKENAFNKDNE